jgi:hypothetical protein
MDYDKTRELYEKAGQIKRWEQTPEYLSHKSELDWYDKVKSKRTGDYYQADELIKREMVPPDWKPPHTDAEGRALKYPVKYVNSITRKRIADGTE